MTSHFIAFALLVLSLVMWAALVVFSAWVRAQLSNQATLSCLTSTLDFEPKH